MVDITFNGITMEFGFVESKMDAGLKQEIQAQNPAIDEQELLDKYMQAHKEKFNEDFMGM